MKFLFSFFFISACSFSQSLNYDYSVTFGNHVIAIDEINYAFQEGDLIGCFFINTNGQLQCCGSTVYNNEEVVYISAWPDDNLTDYEEGFSDGDELIFVFYLCDTDEYFSSEYAPFAENAMEHTEVVFTTNGISIVEIDVFSPPICETFIFESKLTDKKEIKKIDLLGKNLLKRNCNSSFFIIYDDGSVEKNFIIR